MLVYQRYQASVACHLPAIKNKDTGYLYYQSTYSIEEGFQAQPTGVGMLETAARELSTRTSEYLQEDRPTSFTLKLFVTKSTDLSMYDHAIVY